MHKHKWSCIVKSKEDGIFKCNCGLLKEIENNTIKYSECGENINWNRIMEKLDRRKSIN